MENQWGHCLLHEGSQAVEGVQGNWKGTGRWAELEVSSSTPVWMTSPPSRPATPPHTHTPRELFYYILFALLALPLMRSLGRSLRQVFLESSLATGHFDAAELGAQMQISAESSTWHVLEHRTFSVVVKPPRPTGFSDSDAAFKSQWYQQSNQATGQRKYFSLYTRLEIVSPNSVSSLFLHLLSRFIQMVFLQYFLESVIYSIVRCNCLAIFFNNAIEIPVK